MHFFHPVAYNGTKMVVFGGQDVSTYVLLSSIYLLDLKTLVWTRGADADPSQGRRGMACAVAGDNFIAWGGTAICMGSSHWYSEHHSFTSILMVTLSTTQLESR